MSNYGSTDFNLVDRATAHDRPFPIRLGAGELAVNNNNVSPGLFFADNTASPSTGLIKVGSCSYWIYCT